MSQKKTTTKAAPARAAADLADVDAFAHHFSEVLRIARTSGLLPPRFYSALADAWCDLESATPRAQELHDSEAFIRLTLRFRAAQSAGGEGRAE